MGSVKTDCSFFSLEQAANTRGNTKVVRVRRLEYIGDSPEAGAMGDVRTPARPIVSPESDRITGRWKRFSAQEVAHELAAFLPSVR
jgi:hypothetical protein